MGYSCYVYNGPMILVPDMRIPGEDKFEIGMKCPSHGDKKSGEGVRSCSNKSTQNYENVGKVQ